MNEKKSKRYEKIKHLGEGQYANVYQARDTKENKVVAIKKIKLGTRIDAQDGINRTALREIKYLQELSHPNIIGLLDVIGHKSNISLVFDFMETDLEQLIRDMTIIFQPSHVKNFIIQTFNGLEFMHNHWILHRDLKPNNLLLNDQGVLKLADFGLARSFGSPNRMYTSQVVTRWYRAPELLLGARTYGVGVDVWAVGCILAELLLRVPLFPGESDIDQMNKIVHVLGSPSEQEWPNVECLPAYIRFRTPQAVPLKQIFTAADDDLLDVLGRCFRYNPLERCTCCEALKMRYFSKKPFPAKNIDLPLPNRDLGHAAAKRRREFDDESPPGARKKLNF